MRPRDLRTLVGIAIAAALFLGTDAPASVPAPPSAISCSFVAELVYDRPVTFANDEANFSSSEVPVECAGGPFAGAGLLRLVGTAGEAPLPTGGESCLIGAGYGRVELRLLPGTSSETAVSRNFEHHHIEPIWNADGTASLPPRPGSLTITAFERTSSGACIDRPKTRSRLSGQLTITGDLGATSTDTSRCANRVVGTAKGDRIQGSGASDTLRGLGGPDGIGGKRSADCIFGGRGADRIASGPGTDVIHCGPGRDVIRGDRTDDIATDCELVNFERATPRR